MKVLPASTGILGRQQEDSVLNRALLLASVSIFLLSPMAIYADQLVTNGGFETGDLSGWTESGNTSPYSVGVQMNIPHSGNYDAYLGPADSDGYLTQALNTVSGELYGITFWLASDGDTPNDFSAMFGDNILFSQSNLPSSGWTEYSYTAVATSDSTVLQFGFRDDPGYLLLDDVSVSSICDAPEPSTLEFAGIAGLALAALGCRRKRKRVSNQATF